VAFEQWSTNLELGEHAGYAQAAFEASWKTLLVYQAANGRAAIAAAENDALERAAEAANWYAVNGPYGDAKRATIGEHIRALKHKDVS
jgi:hypothetical protein